MYPLLSDNCRIKGCEGNFFTLHLDSFEEYFLNDFQAAVLVSCNGKNSLDSLCDKFNVSKNNLQKFIKELVQLGILNISYSVISSQDKASSKIISAKNPYLKEVHFDITSRCNLKCLHCYQKPYLSKDTGEMQTNEIKSLIDQLAKMNIGKLVISGGEPFLREDLIEIIDYAFKKGIIVPTVFTNGTILNDSLVKICNYDKPISLAVSLDGYNENINDFIRGSDSFKRTIKFLNYILISQKKGSKVKIVIDTMIHPKNFENLQEMFLFLSKLGVQRWRASLPRNQGSFTENQNKLKIELDKVFFEYEKFILWYLKEGRKISSIDIQIESFFRTALIERKKAVFFKEDSCCCEYKKRALAIKPNGDVVGCTAFTNLIIGSLKQKSIKEIWRSQQMQQLKQIRISDIKECANCEYVYLCGTGCRRMALSGKGSLNAKDESICEIYKFFHNRIMPVLKSFHINIRSADSV